jgi:acyl-CoA reductase-like NAD-dependent aldehyde dehydrogenase
MQVIQEQVNWPLLCVTDVEGYDEFKEEVEDNKYGTGIRIFTKDPSKYSKMVRDLEVGIVGFNCGSIIDSDLPIEGWKGSGKGKILSELSYEEYLVSKAFIID